MAIELHHLNTHGMMEQAYDVLEQACDVLDCVVRLKERIAELEKENESLKYSVATLETDLAMSQRWRKCSDEKPDEEQFVLAWLTEDGKRGFFLTSYFIGGKFLIGEDPHGCKPTYWMPLPSAPKEEK